MKIQNPEFVISAVREQDYPSHQKREIAFVGRSNVGKSSMINRLVHRTNLARTSSQPGRTQTINFYKMDNDFYMVDLPGYGFARVPQKVKETWGQMIETYLNEREHLSAIIMLIDARHQPTEDDQMMYEWLLNRDLPTLVVATKADKISRGQRQSQKKAIFETLNLPAEQSFVWFSAENGEGKDEIWGFIRRNI